ncbi:hypothetical protein D3C72_2279590 [compost metagenome]
MVFHEQDILVSKDGGDPVAFAFVQSKAIIVLVNRHTAVELERRLACPDQWLTLDHAERGRIRHMGVKRSTDPRRHLVQPRMDIERGCLRYAIPGNHIAFEIADKQ